MAYDRIVISSGHSSKCPGASDILDEVIEATAVVDRLADKLEQRGIEVSVFHDTKSTTVDQNLDAIVSFHNDRERDLDISVHFNAFEKTDQPMGTEVLYLTQHVLAADLSAAIARCGFIDRGPKYRDDLYVINNTDMPCVLIEVCFVDSETDAKIYREQFDDICDAIADVLAEGTDDEDEDEDEDRPEPPVGKPLFQAKGKMSWFGGPDDIGVADDEPLAFINSIGDAPQLFLPYQPEGTTGLARRLNPYVHYIACRWDYAKTPKDMLRDENNVALVRNVLTRMELMAFPADWGPNVNTGRVADLSPSLMDDLGLTTDDVVEVIYPYRED